MTSKRFILSLSSLALTVFVNCLAFAQTAPSDLCTEFTTGCKFQKVVVRGAPAVEDQYALDVTLGTLSEQQFKDLYIRYATKPGSAYDARRVYKLVDFLPSFVQKLNGKVLNPHTLPADPALVKALRDQGLNVDKVAEVDGNCHSVTWQWVNFLQGKGSDDGLLTLADGENLQLDAPVDVKDIQPGDALVISGNGGFGQVGAVLHSLIYLGHGLVFEKPNPGVEYAYRISYLADAVGKYKKVDSQAQFQFYRISKNSRILPSLTEQLSLSPVKSQQAHGVNLSSLSDAVLGKYILQETWDNQKDESVFTLGVILKTSEASSQKFKSVGSPR